jgi:two-component system, NarL family, response regulator LiaR
MKKVARYPDDFFHFCAMVHRSTTPVRRFSAILLYGLALGLLLASVQVAQYKLLFTARAQDWYTGLIAVLFLTLGVWAGRKWVARRASLSAPVSPPALSDAELDRILEKHRITRREYEVLQLIAEGMSNQEIAARMFVSLNTVKTHTSNLFSKLDARRRTQAVEKARALGLVGADLVRPKA